MAPKRGRKKSLKGIDEPLGRHVSSYIFKRDNKPFEATVKGDFSGNESLAVRVLIREALTARRLKGLGQDASLDAVKNAQHEVVAGETDEIKSMLKDLLAIVRGHGTNLDRVLSVNRETFGVLFHVLRTVFNIEEMSKDYLVRPALECGGKDDDEISTTFSDAEDSWVREAHAVIEAVREQLRQPSF
jgi:hypothetical protein